MSTLPRRCPRSVRRRVVHGLTGILGAASRDKLLRSARARTAAELREFANADGKFKR